LLCTTFLSLASLEIKKPIGWTRDGKVLGSKSIWINPIKIQIKNQIKTYPNIND